MKKETKNLLTVLGFAVTAAALTIIGRKSFKKELENLAIARKEEDDKISELGVSPERMRSQVLESDNPVDNNFVKAMFVGIESNPDWDDEVINPDAVLNSETLVHITEARGQYGERFLDFLLEIPEYFSKTGSYNDLKIGDYFTAMRQLKDYLWSRVIVFSPEPKFGMGAYIAFSYMSPVSNEKMTDFVEIPRRIWSNWAKDGHDGLTEFYEDVGTSGLQAIIKKGGEELLSKVSRLFDEKVAERFPDTEASPNYKFEDIRLMYRISFKEAESDERPIGITIKTGLQSLEYILKEFAVCKNGLRKTVKYSHFMFHAPNDEGKFDSLTRYYVADSKRRIVPDYYNYPE